MGDKDLDLDQTQPQDMNITGIPNQVVLSACQRGFVLQQRELMESHRKIPELIKQASEACGISL